MRIDHFAYQRATRVAGVGFLVQCLIGLTLLILGIVGRDTAFVFGSVYVLLGLLVWVGLIIVFNQHKLERLEALEADELSASRPGSESVFDAAEEEIRVAARRLRFMHRWVMPSVSLLMAASLGLLSWIMLVRLAAIRAGEEEFLLTPHIGWAVAVCLGFAAISFIMSRFVAGMAKQPAWQNLRGGAAHMVGNSLVCLAIAVGIGFRFFGNDAVIAGMATAIPVFMLVVAAEIVLNFILNLYRPRIPGEVPRPAFDSKLLSLFSAPDNLVRSINEAVNYQFGFDVTSSWGYQLFLRSFIWLIGLGVGVMVLLNTIVVVEPHEQAVRVSRGSIDGESVQGSGILWKLPWPVQTAEVYPVTTVRELHLTAARVPGKDTGVHLWGENLEGKFDAPLQPFIVRSRRLPSRDRGPLASGEADEASPAAEEVSRETERVANEFSLVDAEILIQYRVRPEDGQLLRYLDYSSEPFSRRSRLSMLEQALRSLALREVSQLLMSMTIEDVLNEERALLAGRIHERIQRSFDDRGTGVELVGVNIPLLQPASGVAALFEELSVRNQGRLQTIATAESKVVNGFTELVGSRDNAHRVLEEIEALDALRDAGDDVAVVAQRLDIERMILEGGGRAAQIITEAESARWVRLMNARADASRLQGQLVTYRAAPRLYRQRQTMLVYAARLRNLRKYILGIDPSRINFDLDLQELNPLLNIGDVLDDEEGVVSQ
jgi:regulator of protease activity HflC (stomatin/prohibitin superfamily)